MSRVKRLFGQKVDLEGEYLEKDWFLWEEEGKFNLVYRGCDWHSVPHHLLDGFFTRNTKEEIYDLFYNRCM